MTGLAVVLGVSAVGPGAGKIRKRLQDQHIPGATGLLFLVALAVFQPELRQKLRGCATAFTFLLRFAGRHAAATRDGACHHDQHGSRSWRCCSLAIA
jgi:hypothetical protein